MKKKKTHDQSTLAQQLTFEDLLNETGSESNHIKTHKQGRFEKQETSYPIQLVRDFNHFLAYLKDHSVSLTKTRGHISRKYLPDLNESLSVKNDTATSNTEQKYYPYIHFFHTLMLQSRLFRKVPIKTGNDQLQATERLALYNNLTNVEKYLFMLETFWIDVDWDELQDKRNHLVPETLQHLFYHLMQQNSDGIASPNQKQKSLLDNQIIFRDMRNWNHFLLYFEWFGLWKCELDEEAMKLHHYKDWYLAKSITVTEFGTKMIPILLLERNLQFWNIPLRWEMGEINNAPGSRLEDTIFILPEEIEKHFLQQRTQSQSELFLQPFIKLFPEESLQYSLPRQTEKFIDGIYTFKVIFTKGVWRKVVLTGEHTMQNLHEMILQAYEFDNDHLYSFFMDGKKWSKKCIASPHENFGHPQSDRIRIGDLGFIIGQSITYLYDYGDEWIFNIVLEQIEAKGVAKLKPFVKESVGNAPVQYMEWE